LLDLIAFFTLDNGGISEREQILEKPKELRHTQRGSGIEYPLRSVKTRTLSSLSAKPAFSGYSKKNGSNGGPNGGFEEF
jgi:hypothetical protein